MGGGFILKQELDAYISQSDLINGMLNANIGIDIDVKVFKADSNEFVATMKFSEVSKNVLNKIFNK